MYQKLLNAELKRKQNTESYINKLEQDVYELQHQIKKQKEQLKYSENYINSLQTNIQYENAKIKTTN